MISSPVVGVIGLLEGQTVVVLCLGTVKAPLGIVDFLDLAIVLMMEMVPSLQPPIVTKMLNGLSIYGIGIGACFVSVWSLTIAAASLTVAMAF